MGVRKAIITDFSNLTLTDMLDVVKKAEAKREAQCRASAISYLRKKARDAGMTIEDYTKTLDPRGTKRKYFPEGVVAPARRPSQKEVGERRRMASVSV